MSATYSAPLLTDLYELTMAAAYWKAGIADRESVFHLSFRNAPFKSGFTVACGLGPALEFIRNFHFEERDLAFLESVPGRKGKTLFESQFLGALSDLKFRCDIDAVPEGTLVFPHEPLLRVQGPILQAQLVETALLNFLNFGSLIATKAARICLAAQGDSVIEFGLRRAQGPDGGLMASRAAYIGGCSATSNVLAGQTYGIPLAGTHAHSLVLAYETELQAFQSYAKAFPDKCIFLVDTYDSLRGVSHAIAVGHELRRLGHQLAGIRLDSGDLAYLSRESRNMLNAAGFANALIVGSNDLDEHIIASLKQQGAAINVWGVGTRLVTGHDQPALGGVYKLSALRDDAGRWQPKLKLSEQAAKSTTPGIPQVRRFRSDKEFIGDAIYDVREALPERFTIVDPSDFTRRKHLQGDAETEDLLVPICRGGQIVYRNPTLAEARQRVAAQLAMFHPGIKRLVNPHQYPAGLEAGLHELKTRAILDARGAL